MSGLGIALLRPSQASTGGQVYQLLTDRCRIRLTIEFYDRYGGRGLSLDNRSLRKSFCLSLTGRNDLDCKDSFVGAMALARYEVRPHSRQAPISVLREYVRDIDRDDRLNARPPFERTVELHRGVASDVQAFGYTGTRSEAEPAVTTGSLDPWCYFRQDLYLGGDESPFVIIHWKHALSAIRLVDITPAGGTSLVSG